MGKALTFTAIFKANSLNYGEGIANVSELKKIHRGNGDVYTFASRQSIRYDIVRLGNEWFEWNLDTVDKAKGTLQFREDLSIADSVEMDLFGYLKTGKKSQKRPAVVRLSHAISLEPYRHDLEFLNNMGLAERIDEAPNLANIEQHESLYAYTVTVDLDKVGVDRDVVLSNDEKVERLHQFLEVIKLLNRNIRGRQESLSPLFVIGGVYPAANPFFLGRVQLEQGIKSWKLNIAALVDVAKTTFANQVIGEFTHIGFIPGLFANEVDFSLAAEGKVGSVEEFFAGLKQEVSAYFGVNS
ncbi:type I-B CRISPR-associated protein Cas7/Cst2/DevR [Alkalihalobacillus oceani]|uniref:Type I-B CRISPR-associated protein Cas7/Cst2/DevR n=1 Tax=Halalkalibacter oceani TaxID=1653776 RepID=A0A9X2DV09_9BACI|nr:type I-B CRISPR-associated protein Cas7/Cst2/DevR [Halalkalibacter oceani]MCM3715948.1 type I-B CRISPR-associated protein Cas7/Cst2/DevR [Halalkalibacter oceani]MCM3761175.1 type I-B CRISPR-associated protein Cas7/Cst2/DevR [Halalkalibacter oceani]